MTYRDYIEQATADGYPLRYVRVRPRAPQWLLFLAYFTLPLSVIPGCNAIHGAYPDYSYVLLIVWSALAGFVLFAVFAVLSSPATIGFMDLTADTILFLDGNHQLVREISIRQLNQIRERDWTKDDKKPFRGSGGYLHVDFVMNDNSSISCHFDIKPFFKERHENATVPISLLHREAWSRDPYPDWH